MTQELFTMYLERTLRALPPQWFLICDNASCHTPLNLSSVPLETGSTLIDLPRYSPELNPIEKLWANVEQKLKTETSVCISIRWKFDANF